MLFYIRRQYTSVYRNIAIYISVIFFISAVIISGFSVGAYSDSSAEYETTAEETLETEKEPESFFREEYEIIDEITISENPPPMLETIHGTLPETEEKMSDQTETQSAEVNSSNDENKNPTTDITDFQTDDNDNNNIFIYVISIIFACVIFSTIPVIITGIRKKN